MNSSLQFIQNNLHINPVSPTVSEFYLDIFYKEITKPPDKLNFKFKKIAIISLNKKLIGKFKDTFPDILFLDAKELIESEDPVDLVIVSDFFSAFDSNICIDFSKFLTKKSKKCIFAMNIINNKSKPNRPRQLLKLTYLIEDSWAVQSADFTDKFAYAVSKRRKKKKLVFPSRDKHFNRKKDRYQYHVFCLALKYLKNRGLAIDIGSHFGLYTIAMSEVFDYVIAFEPWLENYKCLKENTKNLPNISTLNVAISSKDEMLDVVLDRTNSGNTVFKKGKRIQAKPLDEFNFKNVSLIKIDVQGFEEKVLRGAVKTIKDSRPILIVELIAEGDGDNPNKKALSFLKKELGYKLLFRYGKDFIMGPK